MALYTLSFFAHAVETAWAVRVTTEDSKKNMDYKRTEKVARIATAMMILGFVLLVDSLLVECHGATCMSFLLQEPWHFRVHTLPHFVNTIFVGWDY
jgi:hypothetical protein